MSIEVQDVKIKNLIQVCKETGNTKKLAVVSFILTSNKLDEIGIRFGLKNRNKNLDEKLFEYMEKINDFLESNLKVYIFKQEQIELLRNCELLFLRSKGDVPYEYIKKMFHIYYDLRKLKIPNLNKTMKSDGFLESSEYGLLSFLSPKSHRRNKNPNKLKPLIVQKINEKQLSLQKELELEFNGQKFEKAIYLHTLKKSMENNRSNKIIIQGTLKQNLSYQRSVEDIFKFLLLGLITLVLSLGFIILIELTYYPAYNGILSGWSLFFFGVAGTIIIAYLRYFKKEGR